MADSTVTINGVLYDWESVSIQGPHGTFVGIEELSWESEQKKERRYGKGGLSRGVGRKNFEAKATLKLDLDEYERFASSLDNGVYKTAFEISISIEPPENEAITRTLKDCWIDSIKEDAKQGESNVGQVSLEMTVGMIERNGTPDYEDA